MVDISVLRIQLTGEAEVGKTELRVFGGILALLDVEAGPLDEGVHLHLGVRRWTADQVGEVGHGLRHLLLEDVECGAQKPAKI